MARALRALRSLSREGQQVEAVLENVVGMSELNIQAVKIEFKAQGPYLLCAGGVSFALRPRLWWTTWKVLPMGREMMVQGQKCLELKY